ncbi:MAG: hypothetical protein Q7R40_09890 [Phaeospirillum sp.]|nr:hypothetical protein [Phaeospirillum sp.]
MRDRIYLLAVMAIALGSGPAAAQDASLPAVTIFDSICLQCHEGECSGRLALRTENNPAAVSGHVKGYAGAQSDGVVAELKALLGRVKTECALPPPPVALPADGQWTPALLESLTVADRLRMFVPLGPLSKQAQRLTIQADQADRVRIQIIAQTFDIVVDEDMAIGPERRDRPWAVDEAGLHFLRIISKSPLGRLSIRNDAVR